MRLSIEELLGECRLQGYTDLRDIYYAILEQDGQLSIVPRASKQPLCAEDVQLTIRERGMAHPIILDGRINKNHLAMIGKSKRYIEICSLIRDLLMETEEWKSLPDYEFSYD